MRLLLPSQLVKCAGGESVLDSTATSINALLTALAVQYPNLHERLVDKNHKLNKFVNVYVNDEDIRFLQGQETKVEKDDIVSIIPSIAGG